MNTLTQAFRREARVACSLIAQPRWFRIVKWMVMVALTIRFHDHAWFWPVATILLALALGVHLFYRYKTQAWTHPWGGWNDLEAAKEP